MGGWARRKDLCPRCRPSPTAALPPSTPFGPEEAPEGAPNNTLSLNMQRPYGFCIFRLNVKTTYVFHISGYRKAYFFNV